MAVSSTVGCVLQESTNKKDPVSTISFVERVGTLSVGANEVLVEWKYAPVHPAHINIMQGNYAFTPKLPYVSGGEGSGVVKEVGEDVKNLEAGDKVIKGFGTTQTDGCWQYQQVCESNLLVKVPQESDLIQMSMALINPLTAWGLLDSLWHGNELNPGDWIIQNGANSAVGRSVIQIARLLGYKTFNIVRRESLFEELLEIGADIVVCDNNDYISKAKELGSMKIGLNVVGGDSAKRMTKCLQREGVLVTYGAMSRQPVVCSNSALIFFLISYIGFHMSGYVKKLNAQKGEAALPEIMHKIIEWVAKGEIVQRVDSTFPLEKCKEAVNHAFQGTRNGKVLFNLTKEEEN